MASKSTGRGNLDDTAFKTIYVAARLAKQCVVNSKERVIELYGCSQEVLTLLDRRFVPFYWQREFEHSDLYALYIPMNQVLLKFLSTINYVTQKSPPSEDAYH